MDTTSLQRVHELDGIRAIAVTLVLIWHYLLCQLPPTAAAALGSYFSVLAATRTGVDLFFVLSGFLIGGIILDNRDADNFFRVFYFRRACRIFPIYFVMLVAFSLVSLLDLQYSTWLFGCIEGQSNSACSPALPLYAYAMFAQNFFMGAQGSFGPHWLGISWSLAIEEQFYLVIPLLVVLVPRRPLAILLLSLIVAAPASRFYRDDFQAYVLTFCRADALLVGVLAALIVRSRLWRETNVQTRKVVALACGGVAMGGALLLIWQCFDVRRVWTHSLFAALYFAALLLALALRDERPTSILRTNLLGWLGARSYGIYMLHEAVSGTLHAVFFGASAPELTSVRAAAVTAASLILTLILADLSYRYFEAPFLRVGHRLKYRSEKRDRDCSVQADSESLTVAKPVASSQRIKDRT